MKNSDPPTLQATWKNVLIEPEQRAKEKQGSFYLPKPEFQGVPRVGVVYSVGPDCVKGLKPGDRVIFNEPSPHGFKYSDRVLFPVDESKIVAKVDKGADVR